MSFLCMNQFNLIWIVSFKSLTWYGMIHDFYESIHVWIVSFSFESYHQTLWLSLNRFTSILNRLRPSSGQLESFHISHDLHLSFNLSFCLGLSFLVFESIQLFNKSIHTFVFLRKFSLTTFPYILSSPHNSQFIESFATILSRSKKLIVHKFFEIKHFFLESLCSLSL